jgi:STE24 endopeptidase
LPGLVVATLPALVAMAGLWWGVYPIERESRELSAHDLLEHGLPVFMPPGAASYVWANVRMQMLVTLAPALTAIFMIDLATAGARTVGLQISETLSGAIFVLSLVLLFPLVPWLMKTLLDSSPLAPSELRTRLDELATRIRVRYGDVLVWRTGYGVGNALVIGLLPRLRYVLLSDLLIETLSTRQIEAVFAHEAGHLRHRHLLWFVVFFVTALLTLSGPSDLAARGLATWLAIGADAAQWVMLVTTIAVFVYLFGVVSRHFERQADAYAARAIQVLNDNTHDDPTTHPIGPAGVEAVAAALRQVARVNHMPTGPTPRTGNVFRRTIARLFAGLDHYRHPSIAERIAHLERLTEPTTLQRFDRRADLVVFTLLAALVISGGLTLALVLPG